MSGSANDAVLGKHLNKLATRVANKLATISGGASVAVFTGATASDGTSGLVPAPLAGDNGKFLRGDGTWATVSSGTSGGSHVIGSDVSTVEGGFWQSTINDTPVLKLRHGDYEYNFKYDDLTFLGGVSAPLATVTPDTYVLGTASVSTEGGVWYEVTDNVPQLKLHSGNFNYGFNYDSITYKGNNANLVAYLPFTTTLDDACDNEWTVTGNPTIQDGALYSQNDYTVENNTIPASIGAQSRTIDFWGTLIANEYSILVLVKDIYITYSNGKIYIDYGTEVAANSIEVNTRHHIAMTYDGTKTRLFVDGVLSWEKGDSAKEWSGRLFIRARCWSIDHFRIWNTALWTENFTPPTASDYL